MADITKEDVIEFIANMSVLELSELVKELEDKILALSRAQQMVGRIQTRARNAMHKGENADIKEYLVAQQKVREERAATAAEFIKHNVNPQDLAQRISGKSQLDSALGQRKAVPGSTRPDPRMPVRGTRQAGS